ncbi:MAG: hypothetical protein JSR09_02010 [Bacteroidetes bacterium]|nr:hypothetical protein [Bacteroidota bacterium]MBS1648457.1 hypothetical protein [Bacteroidota bacterium]
MKKLYLFILLLVIAFPNFAQPVFSQDDIPPMRRLHHDNIDRSQAQLIKVYGGDGKIFKATSDDDVNLQLTHIIISKIDNLQQQVEKDSSFSENDKYIWLRSINDMLTSYISACKYKYTTGITVADYINAYIQAMQLQRNNLPITSVIQQNELEIGNILLQNFAFQQNIGLTDCKNILIFKLCQRNPDKILTILGTHTDVPFADSLLTIEAFKNPERFYNYAAVNNALGYKIRSVQSPLVKTISQLATIPSGRFYFPFLDELYHNQITIDSITSAMSDDEKYYKLLVATEIKYAARIRQADTPMIMNVLTEKLKTKGIETYINEINALHEEKSDAVRFKKIDNLTPAELYFLCVLGEEEIYTSSYLGVYKRIFERMKPARADSLLNAVQFDYYKKFIRMAAAYNTLDDFFKRMDKLGAEKLMQSFVDGLEKTSTLEDAVDVADSYASISDSSVKKIMIKEVWHNLQQNIKTKNKRGIIIYNLLNSIFNTTDGIATNTLQLPTPINIMPLKLLLDSTKKKIEILQFFYGDKDGGNVFNAFINNFSNANWRKVDKPEWVEVSSTKGIPITIYANKPLDELKDLDTKAQKDLQEYLDSLNIHPTIVIHRGHSYYVKQTIAQLPSSAKVVLLGSCGGYHSLNDVLATCPGAHIIASKQVGTGAVNIRLINIITETLRQGKDLNWPVMWKNIETGLKADVKERFDDYVPPHKNLGAVFIMAYNQEMLLNK